MAQEIVNRFLYRPEGREIVSVLTASDQSVPNTLLIGTVLDSPFMQGLGHGRRMAGFPFRGRGVDPTDKWAEYQVRVFGRRTAAIVRDYVNKGSFLEFEGHLATFQEVSPRGGLTTGEFFIVSRNGVSLV